MELFNPESGLIIWMLIVFLVVLFILGKFAFPVIIKAVKERETFINDSLKKAERRNEQMRQIQEERLKVLKEAREEQNKVLKDAYATRDRLIDDAKKKASEEAEKLLVEARSKIEAEKEQSMKNIRNQVALLAVDIAEKVVRKNLANDKEQIALVSEIMNDVPILK